MAKAKTPVQDEIQDEVEVEEESNVTRPNDLASELGVDPKRVRAFLRSNFTRNDESKNTNWELNDEMIAAVRERFTPSEDEDSDES